MLLKTFLLGLSGFLFTACICTYCCEDAPSRNVSLGLAIDSSSTLTDLHTLNMIVESDGGTDTLKTSPSGHPADRVGFQRSYGSGDSVKIRLYYKDSMVFASAYAPGDSMNSIRFRTDTAIACAGKQIIALDSASSLSVCRRNNSVACL